MVSRPVYNTLLCAGCFMMIRKRHRGKLFIVILKHKILKIGNMLPYSIIIPRYLKLFGYFAFKNFYTITFPYQHKTPCKDSALQTDLLIGQSVSVHITIDLKGCPFTCGHYGHCGTSKIISSK